MTTLVISLMVLYSGTCFVLYLLLIRTLVIAAHVLMEAAAKLVSQVKVFGVSVQKNSAEEKSAKVL